MVVTFTGRLTAYSRQDAQNLIEAKGAKVTDRVDDRTTHLVVGGRRGHKFIQAKNSGIIIITEEEFHELIR